MSRLGSASITFFARTRGPLASLAAVLLSACALPISAVSAQSVPASRPAASKPASPEAAFLGELDAAIEKRQFAVVLSKIAQRAAKSPITAEVRLRAARAHLELGDALGRAEVRRIAGGVPGRFIGEWLVVEPAGPADEFLCAPPASACNQVRRAIDGGVDTPAAQRLFAEIWLAAKRPKNAIAVLRAHERLLLDDDTDAALRLFARAHLAANDLEEYLSVMQRLAQRSGERKDAVLADAYFAVADVYNLRGDEALHREFLRRALKLAPETESRMLELADALWAAEEKAEARGWYRKLIDRRPAHPERLRILQRVSE
ncbi:MAG: hypothetical protein IT450_05175 [Phycisphaerales bacterium]|nr:hypothetical protein [Phycisphaerales bacterium]